MSVGFYVTVNKSDLRARMAYARGPFGSHEDALAAVEPTRLLASKKDPWSAFYAWGTSRLEAEALPIGPMNRFWTTDGY